MTTLQSHYHCMFMGLFVYILHRRFHRWVQCVAVDVERVEADDVGERERDHIFNPYHPLI